MFTETSSTRRCPDRDLRTLAALREGSSKLHCSYLGFVGLFWEAMGQIEYCRELVALV